MSYVYARELPLAAFWWEHSAEADGVGNAGSGKGRVVRSKRSGDMTPAADFARLEADVRSAGGQVELKGEGVCVIRLHGREMTLTIGFAVVLFPGGSEKYMSIAKFRNDYDVIDDLADAKLLSRMDKLEETVASIEAALKAM